MAGLCSLAGWYDNPIPTRFLSPIDCLNIPALYTSPPSNIRQLTNYGLHCDKFGNFRRRSHRPLPSSICRLHESKSRIKSSLTTSLARNTPHLSVILYLTDHSFNDFAQKCIFGTIKTRVRICKPFKEPKNRFTAWRNRVLSFLNVYKYGL